MIIKLIHWIGVILVWFSALLVPKRFLPWAMAVQVGTLLSWLMFHRCILWDLEKKMNPGFKVEGDTTASKLNMDPSTVKRFTHSLIYTNLMLLGYRMGVPEITALVIVLYVIINKKFEHRGDDDLNKYM